MPETLDGRTQIGLIWTARPPAYVLAASALRSTVERTSFAAIRADEARRLREARDQALLMTEVILEARDLETQGHTERVARPALELADTLGLPSEDREALHLGALLHDLGKSTCRTTWSRKRGR